MKYLESKSAIAVAGVVALGLISALGFAYYVGDKVSDEIIEQVEQVDQVENTDQAELEVDVVAPEGDIIEITDEVVEEIH